MADLEIVQKIRQLQAMSVGELLVEWERLYGESTRTRNKAYLWKRLAWRVQELKYGGLSDAAKQRLKELAPTGLAFVRARRPDGFDPEEIAATGPATTPAKTKRDARLPVPGSVITRTWRGHELRLLVRDNGFELEGTRYGSLSEAARGVTGAHWNGRLFWLGTPRTRR